MTKITDNQIKQLKLSSTGKMAVLMAMTGMSSTAMADITAADANTQVNNIDNVDVVNIATPNTNGLSHNKFIDFNVSTHGAVMNNALEAGQSQLAGNLGANSNLQGQAAAVILNEVISNNPSLLLGQQEVFGIAADYVLANPNGITSKNSGFINTPRASLVVGTPTINDNQLAGFDVTNNNGLMVEGTIDAEAVLNLIAPSVEINGDITSGEEVNIVMGNNTIDFDGGELTATANDTNTVLDAKLMGSIQSGSIRIHSNDSRTTLEATNVDWSANDLSVKAAGSAKIQGTVSQTGSNSENTDGEYRVNTKNTTSASSETFESSNINADNVNINVANELYIVASDISGNDVNIVGGSVDVTSVTTTNAFSAVQDKSKGTWTDKLDSQSHNQEVHSSDISATNNLNIAASIGDLYVKSAILSAGNDLDLASADNVKFEGDVANYERKVVHDFKNEGGKLKTGSTLDSLTEDSYIATKLQAKNLLIAGEDSVTLKGVQANVDTALITSDVIELDSEVSHTSSKKIHQETYWGRLFGATAEKDITNIQTQNSTNINATGTILLKSDSDVIITASNVEAIGDAYVSTTDGNIVIQAAEEINETITGKRKGSLFNITSADEQNWDEVKTSKASVISSDANLELISENNIDIVGSKLAAAGLINLVAKNVNITTAENVSNSSSSQVGVNAPTFEVVGINSVDDIDSVEEVAGVVTKIIAEGQIGASAAITFFDKKEESQITTATGSTITGGDVNIYTDETTTVIGSKIEATDGDLVIDAPLIVTGAAENVTVTDVNDTEVTLGINAAISMTGVTPGVSLDVNNVHGTITESEAVTSELTANNGTVDLGINNLLEAAATGSGSTGGSSTGGVTFEDEDDGDYNFSDFDDEVEDTTTVTIVVEPSPERDEPNVIIHQGTNISGVNVVQNATEITQTAAVDSVEKNLNTVDVGLALGVTGEFTGGVNGTASISAQGSNTVSQETTAVVTNIEATDSIEVNSETTLTDEGTDYTAEKEVILTADNYENTAAENTSSSVSHVAGGDLSISVGLHDSSTIAVSGDLGLNYQYEKGEGTQAVQSSISGENVSITAENVLNSEANIAGTDTVKLEGAMVNQNQSENTASSTSGGFELGLGAGALISTVTGGVPIPTIDADASINGGGGSSTTGVGTEITSNNVEIIADQAVSLEGANITGTDTVKIEGNKVDITGTSSSGNNVDVNLSAHVSISEEMEQVGGGGRLDVAHEVGQGGEAVTINGSDVTIEAKDDIDMLGVVVNADTVDLSTDGDINIEAINNTYDKNNVSLGLNLSGSTTTTNTPVTTTHTHTNTCGQTITHTTTENQVSKEFGMDAGSGHITVDLADNSTWTEAGINADTVNITAQDVTLVGATIVADTVNGAEVTTNVPGDFVFSDFDDEPELGKISGKLTTVNVVNTIEETSVHIAANASKPVFSEPETTTVIENVVVPVTTTHTHTNACGQTVNHTVTENQIVQQETQVQTGGGEFESIDAGFALDVAHNSSTSNQTAGIIANTINLDIAESDIDQSAVVETSSQFGFDFAISANPVEMATQAAKDLIKGDTPIVHVDGVSLPHKGNTDIEKANVDQIFTASSNLNDWFSQMFAAK